MSMGLERQQGRQKVGKHFKQTKSIVTGVEASIGNTRMLHGNPSSSSSDMLKYKGGKGDVM